MTLSPEQKIAILNLIHSSWTPHEGQIKAGKALFTDKKRRIFLSCGRKFGKTELVQYILTRFPALNPGSECYYYAPTRKQAKQIIWRRLKKYIPKELLKGQNVELAFKEQDLSIRFWNGSVVVIDSADNEDAGRGITPDLVVYDEFKDFKEGFHIAMAPNLIVRKAPLIVIGTPPDKPGQFTQLAQEIRTDSDGFYLELPTWANPHIPKEDIERDRLGYEARGELDIFVREFEGRFVMGGSGSIFPMFDMAALGKSESELMETVRKDANQLQWVAFSDPGTASCFAVLIAAYNPYKSKLYILDEIYEKNPQMTSTRRIWPRIESLMRKWNPHLPPSDMKWYKGYDEAAAWFANEVIDTYAISLTPTSKSFSKKENGLSLIKDQMISKTVEISVECQALAGEIQNYIKDSNGNIPTKNDHCIDIWRYINAAVGYTFIETKPEQDQFEARGYRAVRPADEFDLEDMFSDDSDEFNFD